MENPFDLSGHVALVTGGNSGIGLGMAEGLAAAGANVAIWGRNEAKNEAAVEKLATYGTDVAAWVCDVSDEEQVEASFHQAVERFGHIDSCFANAGVGGFAESFLTMDLEEWRRVVRINLEGAFLTLRAAANHMVERGQGGSLVGVASLAAISGQARGEHYSASKGGLVSMMRSIAVELARHQIRANTVLPGWIDTPMTGGFDFDAFRQKVLPRIPARRVGLPEDFGPIAVYLASKSTNYTSGQEFIIDGGYMAF